MEKPKIEFCDTPLWNSSLIISNSPDFTSCFHKTILIWIPCLVLFIYSPISVYLSFKKYNSKFTLSWIFITKLVVCFLLIGFELGLFLTELIESFKLSNVYLVDMIRSIILIISFVYVILLNFIFNRNGQKFSIIVTLYWTILIISYSITLRSKLINFPQNKNFKFWVFVSTLGFIIFNWFLSFFSEHKEKINKKLYPESNANLISWLTFTWISKLIYKGYKKNLDTNDVWGFDEENSSKDVGEELEQEWNRLKTSYDMKKRSVSKKSLNHHEEFELKEKVEFNDGKRPSLGLCILRIHLKNILIASVLVLSHDLLDLTGPLILDGLINFVSNDKYPKLVGYFFAILLFIRLIILSLCQNHNFNYAFLAGVRTRSALMNLIYKKSLRLSTESRRKATTGEILNLMQVNTHIFVELSMYGHQLWSGPIKVILSSVILWFYLGPAVFAGLGAMAVLVPLNSIFMGHYSKAETRKLKFKDSKMKILNEVLNGIKVIKFYGWEISFENLINKIRNQELKVLHRASISYCFFNFSFGFTTFAVTFFSLLTYIYISGNVLTPNVAYVSFSLFNTIRLPLFLIGPAISNFIQTLVSLKRIQKFLFLEEIDDGQISYEKDAENAILFEKATFSWSKYSQDAFLRNLNLSIPRGKLIAVVGKVGSGKSSLLSSILGEMNKTTGYLNVDGSISYVPQQAWIQNATVKENILFGTPYDEAFYNKVLKSCALVTDLSILTAGDKTEIGEKGINLSGGQKQRISLSRAVYNNSDIYLLDDPLSAVDAHVGKHIFDNVIGHNGILKNKTRILVTNSINFLPEVDTILMLEQGDIIEVGSYTDLMKQDGKFSKFISNSFVNESESKKSQDEENKSHVDDKIEAIIQEADDDEETGKLIESEKIEVGNLKFKTIISYFKSSSLPLTMLFLICYALMNVFYALSSFWLTEWTNSNISESGDSLTKGYRILIYGILGLAQNFFSLVAELVSVKMIMNSCRNLHEGMLKSIMRSTMQFFESTPIGRILNRFSKDATSLELVLPYSFKDIAYCLFDVLTAIVVISISTPLFLSVLAPMILVYFFLQRYYVASSSKLKRLDSASKSPIFSHFGETLNGITTIKAYKAQKRFISIIEKKIDDNNMFFYPSMVTNRWSAIAMEGIGNFLTLAASIFAINAKGSISPGIIGLSITFALNISGMLRYAVKCAAEFESNMTSVERIKEYSTTPQEADWENKSYKPCSDWPNNGEITFKDYSVRYREDLDYALKSINCEIKPSEKIGIVGRTGAGKSSLSLGLFRLLESKEGEIIIDGMNINKMGLHDLRQKLTIIPQDPVLFSGSLRMNLDPFEQSTDEQIWSALEKAHLKPFIEKLDGQLLFECSEGGENLSVGQRQLICLARALLRNSKILLLDEATAAIDHHTDDIIQETIRNSFSHCTMLTIAHRLNTIMDSDRIIVLDKGSIIEFDTPKNLLFNKNSLFYSMALTAGIVNEF
nr:ATP-binding cassette subfamily C1-1 [Brachionus rubens]